MKISIKNILITCAVSLLCNTTIFPNTTTSATPATEYSLVSAIADKTIAFLSLTRDGIYNFSSEYIAPYISPIIEKVAFNEYRAEIFKAIAYEDYANHKHRIANNIITVVDNAQNNYGIYINPDLFDAKIDLKSRTSGLKATTIDYLQQYIDHHQKNNKPIIDTWETSKKAYEELASNQELQAYLNSKNQNPNLFAFKNVCRGIGYTASCALGLYAGNAIYKNYLDQYFTDNSATSRQNLMEKLLDLKEQCSDIEEKIETRRTAMEDASSEQQAKLKNIIEKLERSLTQIEEQITAVEEQMQHPVKPSALKKYSGIAVRIAVMAAATYLCYSAFRALDERYFAPAPITLSNPAWEVSWEDLNGKKTAFDASQEKVRIYKSWMEDVPRKKHLAEALFELIQLKRDERELEATHAMNATNYGFMPFDYIGQRLQ